MEDMRGEGATKRREEALVRQEGAGGGGARGPGHATRGDGLGRPVAVRWPLGNAVEFAVAGDRAGRRRQRR